MEQSKIIDTLETYHHTLNINGLLNLDRSDTHIHNIEAKKMKS